MRKLSGLLRGDIDEARVEVISADQVLKYLLELAPVGASMNFLILDSEYTVATVSMYRKIAAQDTVKYWPYRETIVKRDCNRMAMAFQVHLDEEWDITGCAMVIDKGGRHAYNIVFDTERAYIFDPQSQKFPTVEGPEEPYFMKEGYVII